MSGQVALSLRRVAVEARVERSGPDAALGLVFSASTVDGCLVTRVAAGSPASTGGVLRGMVITAVNGQAVRCPADAKAAGAGATTLVLSGWVDERRRRSGRVVWWEAGRGFGKIALDEPVLGIGAEGQTELHTGHVFCHVTECRGFDAAVGDVVELEVRVEEGGRLRAVQVALSQRGDSRAVVRGSGRRVRVEWWNVNNLRECNRVSFEAHPQRAGHVLYAKNGEARPECAELRFDGEEMVSLPGIGKRVRVPYGPERQRVLAGLHELAEAVGVAHNMPAGGVVAVPPGGAGEGRAAGRASCVMARGSTDRLWIGWLASGDEARALLTRELAERVRAFLAGHEVASVRACYSNADVYRVAAVVDLRRPVTQLQVAELNAREYRDGRRLAVDDMFAERREVAKRRDGAGAGAGSRVDATLGRVSLQVALAVDEQCVAAAADGAWRTAFGLEVGPGRVVTRVCSGGRGSHAGLMPTVRVDAVGGVETETDEALEEALCAAVSGAREVRMTVSVDSSARVQGTVDMWDAERGRGRVSPDVPLVMAQGLLPGGGGRGTATYFGDVGCESSALRDGVRSAAPGQAVEFGIEVRRGRVHAVGVTGCGGQRVRECGEDEGRRMARAGDGMARRARGAERICMMHLGGRCQAQGGTCVRGEHMDLPCGAEETGGVGGGSDDGSVGGSSSSGSAPGQTRRCSPNKNTKSAITTNATTDDEAELRRVLTRVSSAKLELLRQQVAEASSGGGLEVIAAWQLRNEALEFRFRATEYNMTRAYGKTPDMIDGFHGTAEQNVLSIAAHGFDPLRRSGQVFGTGEYFAKDPDVSVGYCGGGGFMFVCSLLLGEAGADHKWVGDMGYYVMNQREGNIQCLPRYLIQFQFAAGGACAGGGALLRTLQTYGGEAAEAEEVRRRVGETQRGGLAACRGRIDGTMMAAQTRCLWMGWLDPALAKANEAEVRHDVERFLGEKHTVVRVKVERNAARVGAYVELAEPISQLQLAELNTRAYGARGERISVDDAQPANPALRARRCPKLTGPGRFCRGWNLRGQCDWTEACSFRHAAEDFVHHGAVLQYEEVAEGTAKYDEMSADVEAKGLGHVTRVRRVVNTHLEGAYESRRAFMQALHGYVAEKELWHGTACSVLDQILTTGLQPPSDTQSADECPVSGGKGLSTTLCGTDCRHCVRAHRWGKCHMFGLGVYLADDPGKAHRHVKAGRTQRSLVRCRVNLGSPCLIESNLVHDDAMHDVVRCTDPTGLVEDMVHAWDTLKGHDSYYVKGLGNEAKEGLGVRNSEYIVFHPAQVMPLYVVDYETEDGVAAHYNPLRALRQMGFTNQDARLRGLLDRYGGSLERVVERLVVDLGGSR